MAYRLIAVGRLKPNQPEFDIIERYKTRLKTSFDVIEIDIKNMKNPKSLNAAENKAIIDALEPDNINIALDRLGKTFSSEDFSQLLSTHQQNTGGKLTFIIGGADGLSQDVRDMCSSLISFGKQTWPHMLARVMLLEQLYRAQCIQDGHPYHK